MATIEPRLIHLLNDATTPHLASTDLPPLQPASISRHPDRLPPLEPDAGNSVDKVPANPVLAPYLTDDSFPPRGGPLEPRYPTAKRNPASSSHSLRLLLGDHVVPDTSSSWSKMLGDSSDAFADAATKKRHRTMPVKDDFVQLPQPVKKQKATQQQVMPPIINGLLEPPPDAALFPPIASSSFNDNDLNHGNLLREFTHVNEDRGQTDKPAGVKTRRRSTKPRRKWTEAETKDLLLGVNRHGVGKWTSILEDPDFKFNDRTAGDLKDRFRTCCPEELRKKLEGKPNTSNQGPSTSAGISIVRRPKAKSGLLSENILINMDEEPPPQGQPTPIPGSNTSTKPKKTRAHRKNLGDLAELGIHGPFKQSRRRERRPFTEEDDQQILEGLDLYGPAWTKIQRDPRFNLSSRQPTDLRDRVRNKHPVVYQRIEKGLFQIKEPNRGNDLLEPSVNMTIENSLTKVSSASLDNHLIRPGSREEMRMWPGLVQAIDLPELPSVQAVPSVGEMDISRFLLDNPSIGRHGGKHTLTGFPSRSSSPIQ